MYYIVLIIVGGILGWLASIVMKTDGQQGLLLNVVVGIVGSCLGNLILGPLFGLRGSIGADPLNPIALLTAFLGALILLAIVNLVRRGRVR